MRRPSPALIVATAALFVSLGGTSYAISKLPKNSVGGSQLRANAVTGPKIKNGTVGLEDLAAGAVVAGPRGPRGAEGPQGPAGADGPSNALFRHRNGNMAMAANGGPEYDVFKVTLPTAGSWVLTSAVPVAYFPAANTSYAWIRCWYSVGGLDEPSTRWHDVEVGQGAGAAQVVPITLQTTVEAAAPTAVDVTCKSLSNVPDAPAENRPFIGGTATFSAVRAGSVDRGTYPG